MPDFKKKTIPAVTVSLIIPGMMFFHGCVTPGQKHAPLPPASKRRVIKRIPWQLTVQPGTEVNVFINGMNKEYTWLSRDKSMRTLQLVVPLYGDGLGFDLKVTGKGFHEYTTRIELQGKDKRYLEQPRFVALDRLNSSHRFAHYWRTGSQPKSVRFIDAQRVAVPLLNDTGIDIINIHTGKTVRIAPPERFSRKEGFVESLVIQDRDELWVSQMNTGSLHVFDIDTLAYKKTIKTKGVWGKVIIHDPLRDRVYFSNWESKNISVIDAKKYIELYTMPVQGVPRGMALSEDKSFLYVCQYGRYSDVDRKGQLVKVSLDNNSITAFFGKDGAKRHAVPVYEKNLLFVSDMARDQVIPYNLNTNRSMGAIKVYDHPNTIALTPDKKLLYVSCRGKNNPKSYLIKGYDLGRIFVIDTANMKVVEQWEGGNQPTGLDVSPDGKYVVFSDFLDDAIRVYRRVKPSSP